MNAEAIISLLMQRVSSLEARVRELDQEGPPGQSIISPPQATIVNGPEMEPGDDKGQLLYWDNDKKLWKKMTAPTAQGQVLWWDEVNSEFKLTVAPECPSILVYDEQDSSDGIVRWVKIAYKYQTAYRNEDGNMQTDYLRAI